MKFNPYLAIAVTFPIFIGGFIMYKKSIINEADESMRIFYKTMQVASTMVGDRKSPIEKSEVWEYNKLLTGDAKRKPTKDDARRFLEKYLYENQQEVVLDVKQI